MLSGSIREAEIAVIQACYCDSDRDGWQDDAEVVLNLAFRGGQRNNFALQVILELPSGVQYGYTIQGTTVRSSFSLVLYFYNHATECGMYQFSAYMLYRNAGNLLCASFLEFDPPGSTDGSQPTLGFRVI
jgi:hypothetical protein